MKREDELIVSQFHETHSRSSLGNMLFGKYYICKRYGIKVRIMGTITIEQLLEKLDKRQLKLLIARIKNE